MKNFDLKKIIVQFLAYACGILFIISYLKDKDAVRLVLGITWLLIGIVNTYNTYKKR